MTLNGGNALVTGTSRGIGPAIARGLAREGARVLCHARRENDALALADELGGVAIVGDLSTEEGVRSVAGQVSAAAPQLQILVHNAAVNPRPDEKFDEVDREIFGGVLQVNVFAPLFLTQALLGPLRAAGSARVVILSSNAGQFAAGLPGDGLSYRVSKAAVNAVSAVVASALRDDGILVNAMHPGWVKTDMGGTAAPLSPDEGADTAIYLATLPDDGPSGGFFYKRQEIDW
ncbi:MAG TPA: SDR family NAD(P)-dependent oxidoreductase [Streptosporangiaceae bacterium]|nr:SDR family NAD(P)-dependent oxidoreductase [Streptosporangiaceae bacterium]